MLFLKLRDDRIEHMGGYIFIMVKGHCEVATPLGDRAQIGDIALAFSQWHLGLHHGLARTSWQHTHHAPSPRIDVAHDIASIMVGHHDLKVIDRLHEHWLSLGCSDLKSLVASSLECNLFAIDRMLFAIKECYAYINY